MRCDGRITLLIDNNREDAEVTRRRMPGISILQEPDYRRIEKKISSGRRIVLISSETDRAAVTETCFFITSLDATVTAILVFSSEGTLPTHLIKRPFIINRTIVFFSNGGDHGEFLRDRSPIGCDICNGTGHIVFESVTDVCPKCGHSDNTGKDWAGLVRAMTMDGPFVVSAVIP